MTVKSEVNIVLAGCCTPIFSSGKLWNAVAGLWDTLKVVTKGCPLAGDSRIFGCSDYSNGLVRMTVTQSDALVEKTAKVVKPWEKLIRRSLVFVVDLMASEENLRLQHSFTQWPIVYHDIEHMIFDNWTPFYQKMSSYEIAQEKNETQKLRLKIQKAEELCRKFLFIPQKSKTAKETTSICPYFVDHSDKASVAEAWQKIVKSIHMRDILHGVIGGMQ